MTLQPTDMETAPSPAIFRALSDHSPEGILVVDTATRKIVEANVRLGELFGIDPSSLLHREMGQACHELGYLLEDSDMFREALARYVALPEASGGFKAVTGGDDPRYLSGYVTPVRSDSGEVVAKLFSFRDASAQRALEKGLRESQQLETAARLATGIVHDSNNLLTVVLGQLHFARDSLVGNPEALAAVVPAMDAAQKCAGLLKNVLRIARNQGGHHEVVHWKGLLQDTEALLRAAAPASITLHTQYEEDLPPVQANPVQLHQVIMNLVFNAIDALTEGGDIHLTLSRQKDDVCLAVRDNGTGMPPEVKERTFNLFFTTKNEEKGTGLGLHMVHEIVKAHGGTIRCESEAGWGTTFLVALPMAKQGPAEAEACSVRASSQPEVVSC